MDPQEIFRQALAALERGDYTVQEMRNELSRNPVIQQFLVTGAIDQQEIDRMLAAAQFAHEAGQEALVARATERASEHSPASNAARMAAQSLSFGFADDLVGLLGGDAEASRQRVADLRTAAPGASFASELAGAAATAPFGGLLARGAGQVAGRVGGQTGRAILRGSLPAAATGRVVGGAVEGAVEGAGEAEPGERGAGGLFGGILGGATGGLLSGGVSVGRRARGAGPRLANTLREVTGFSGEINPVRDAAERRVEIVRRGFQRLDEEFPEVDDPELLGFLDRMRQDRDGRSALRSVSKDLADPEGRTPSFSDFQELRQKLRSNQMFAQADELTEMMQDAFGERFLRTNRRFAQAMDAFEQIDEGIKAWNWGAERLERHIDNLTTPNAVQNFQRGRLSEIIRRMEVRDRGSLQPIKNILEAGDETTRQLRTLFRGEGGRVDEIAFRTFDNAVRQEKDLEMARKIMRAAGVTAGMLTAGFSGGAAFGFFN